jgi:hypothetical protein
MPGKFLSLSTGISGHSGFLSLEIGKNSAQIPDLATTARTAKSA